ncbi:MAG: NifU family protein [Mycoplasmataceae bacterium]|jgi:Fe-S cluster biogenesis protein NfuA|nr:NifU family protein [Mycoplasmataceae bacterium]
MKPITDKVLTQIKDTIETLRVYINNDGGDLSFVSCNDGILILKISGACVGCVSFSFTFDQGVKEVLMTEYHDYLKDVKFEIKK